MHRNRVKCRTRVRVFTGGGVALWTLVLLLGCSLAALPAAAHDVPSAAKPQQIVHMGGGLAQPESALNKAIGTRALAGIQAVQAQLVAVPAFTEADVRQFVATQPIPYTALKLSDAAYPTTVEQVRFLSGAAVGAAIHHHMGVPASKMLCLVIVRGPFSFSGPNGLLVTFQYGFEVFDAETGNLLMEGGLND